MRSLRLRSEEGTWEHKCKGIENDEGQNGTIYSANSSARIHTDYIGTTDENSTRDIVEGEKEGSTIDGMSTWETIEGVKIGS
jgi:hypothetical protein